VGLVPLPSWVKVILKEMRACVALVRSSCSDTTPTRGSKLLSTSMSVQMASSGLATSGGSHEYVRFEATSAPGSTTRIVSGAEML
jgi:hypothetical protein